MSETTQLENSREGEKTEGIPQGQDPIDAMRKWFIETDEKPWINIAPGETKTLVFVVNKTQKVVKNFQGQDKTQFRFVVVTEENKEKTIDFSPRWARAIFDLLAEGYQKIRIGRTGAGTDTNYKIVPLQH